MSFFQRRLEAFPRLADYRLAKAAGYWPYYKTVESASRPRFTIEGNEYINFGSNNYLSLSYHPEVIEAAQRATSKYGTGVTGSRLLNGTLDLHRELENELATFYGREAALVFSTGYVANVSTISGLLHRHDYVVLDKDAHNSLLTGAQLSGATMKRFGHNDLDRLAKILGELPADAGKGVIVDGVYSMGGDTAPLSELVTLCRELPEHVPPRRRGPRLGRSRRARTRRGRTPRSGVRRRPHHDHVLEDARLLRWRARRVRRRDRAAHARLRPADLHRIQHAWLARRRAGRAARARERPRDDQPAARPTSISSWACSPSAACR